MAKLNEYDTWKQNAITYWEGEIDTAVESNQSLGYSDPEKEQMRTDMKASLATYMNAFDTKVTTYQSDEAKRDRFGGVILSIATYASGKTLAATPEAPVKDLSTLPNDDVRDLFSWWNVEIPSYQTLFSTYIAMESTDPEDPLAPEELAYSFDIETPYDDLLAAMDGYGEDDKATIGAFVEEVATAMQDRTIYLMTAGGDADIVRSDTPLKDIVLEDYHCQEVVDEFGWTFKGLNA